MGNQCGDRTSGIDVLPLFVGEETYAVKLDRVATVLRTGVLDDADPGSVIDVADHTVEIADAASLLGERSGEVTAVVVFHGKGTSGHVPGWLVAEVGDPTNVEEIRATVGSIRHVRGKVRIDGDDVVLIDPIRIHRS
ncbi:hypothetical protein GCM10028857_08260 [Salinarchaeum chitinilyticum]